MTSSLNSDNLMQWLSQLEHQMDRLANDAEYQTGPSLLIATQMNLSFLSRNHGPGLEITAAKTAYDAQWMEKVLRQRFLDLAYYDNCIPLVHHAGDWLIWYPTPLSQPKLTAGVHCLLDLVELDISI